MARWNKPRQAAAVTVVAVDHEAFVPVDPDLLASEFVEQPVVSTLTQLRDGALALSRSGDYSKAHALETAALRLGEFRNVLDDTIEAADADLRAVLEQLRDLI